MSEEALSSVFAQQGRTVRSVSIISDRQTGESHGYAFVDMATDEDAAHALAALNGSELRGHKLHVSEARGRPRSSSRT